MHDVLGHRLSLLSLHASVLELWPGAPPEEIARTAAVIGQTAHRALEDLRQVIGVLRSRPLDGQDDGSAVPEPPQPTLADLPSLIAESQRAGMSVSLDSGRAINQSRCGDTAHNSVAEQLNQSRCGDTTGSVKRMSGLTDIVLDCRHAAKLARFWEAALGWRIRPYDQAEIARLAALGLTPETDPMVAIDSPDGSLVFLLQQVPEPKIAKNRMHIGIRIRDRAHWDELVGMGATVISDNHGWQVVADPEGNEFCAEHPH